jgi:hypothetical protein
MRTETCVFQAQSHWSKPWTAKVIHSLTSSADASSGTLRNVWVLSMPSCTTGSLKACLQRFSSRTSRCLASLRARLAAQAKSLKWRHYRLKSGPAAGLCSRLPMRSNLKCQTWDKYKTSSMNSQPLTTTEICLGTLCQVRCRLSTSTDNNLKWKILASKSTTVV